MVNGDALGRDPHNLITAKDSGQEFGNSLKLELSGIDGVRWVTESGSGHKLRVVFDPGGDSTAIRVVEDRLGKSGQMGATQEGYPMIEYLHDD